MVQEQRAPCFYILHSCRFSPIGQPVELEPSHFLLGRNNLYSFQPPPHFGGPTANGILRYVYMTRLPGTPAQHAVFDDVGHRPKPSTNSPFYEERI